MELSESKNAFSNASKVEKLIFIAIIFTCFLFLFYFFPPKSVDFRSVFYPASFHFFDPYSIRGFINPPWTTLFIYPFRFFSIKSSVAINASLNFIVFTLLIFRKNGGLFSFLLTFSSTPFLLLIAENNLDWIPALGILLENNLSSLLILTKPQSGSFILVNWFIRSKNKLLFIIIPSIVVALSFIIWPSWFGLIIKNIIFENSSKWIGNNWINLSLFPWTIPLGLFLIAFILVKKPPNGDLLGILSTFFLVPYFAIQSLTILMVYLSLEHKRIATGLWIILWTFQIYHIIEIINLNK